MSHFEVKDPDEHGKVRATLIATNGEPVAQLEPYADEFDALRGCRTLVRVAMEAATPREGGWGASAGYSIDARHEDGTRIEEPGEPEAEPVEEPDGGTAEEPTSDPEAAE